AGATPRRAAPTKKPKKFNGGGPGWGSASRPATWSTTDGGNGGGRARPRRSPHRRTLASIHASRRRDASRRAAPGRPHLSCLQRSQRERVGGDSGGEQGVRGGAGGDAREPGRDEGRDRLRHRSQRRRQDHR